MPQYCSNWENDSFEFFHHDQMYTKIVHRHQVAKNPISIVKQVVC
jgi:hypothetical protein